jgi:cell division protein ZapA
VSPEPAPVTIRILDKEYRIACPEEEREALLESARYLHGKMKQVRDTGKVIGSDRISLMAALNIAHELLQYKNQIENLEGDLGSRLLAVQRKMDVALDKGRQMEL